MPGILLKVKMSSLLLFFSLFLGSASSLYFHMEQSDRKCFIEEIPDDTVVMVNYKVQLYEARTHSLSATSSDIGMHVEVWDPHRKIILSKVYSTEGTFTFASILPGEHVICLYARHKHATGTQLRIHLDIQVGDHAFDYTSAVRKEKLSELQLRARQLLNQVEQMAKEQNYHRFREQKFRQMSEATNQMVLWWALVQTCVLLVMGVAQIRHLKSFFEVKKIV